MGNVSIKSTWKGNKRGKQAQLFHTFLSLEFGFTKTVQFIIQFDKLIGEEFKFNILKDIVCEYQQKIVIFELTQCSINKTVLNKTSLYVLHGIAWVVN